MAFVDLQNEALGDDFNATKYRDRVKQWINEAERKIFRRAQVPEGDWTEAITTVAGTATVNLDVGLVRVNSLRNTTDHEPLDEVAIEDIDDAPSASGEPDRFALVGNKLVLYPTPDRVYNLEARYQARATALVADADVPQLNLDYQDMLVTYARSRLFRAEGDFDAATALRQEFESELSLLRSSIGRRSRGRRRQVPGMWAGSSAPAFRRP